MTLEYENTYNAVNNPIPRSGIFATMALEEIQAYIENLPKKERASASLVMMWTLNACNKLVQDEVLNKEIFA